MKLTLNRLALVGLLLFSACGSLPGSLGGNKFTAVCESLAGLRGQTDDYKAMSHPDAADKGPANLRISERATSSVAALRAMEDGEIADQGLRLATVEEGLLGVLATFRAAESQKDWISARAGYAMWHSKANPVVIDASSRLTKLGMNCG